MYIENNNDYNKSNENSEPTQPLGLLKRGVAITTTKTIRATTTATTTNYPA